jgi:ABC-2 type transport system ATP-binding protein
VYGFDPVADSANVRLRCGVLLEHTGLYERLTALDNLLYFGRIWKIGRGDLDERIRLLLSRFALWERRTDRVEGWSRGMKQKLAIARALLHRPALLFLDEPTTGLDLMSAASLREYIAGLRDLGTTIFLNTHNLHEAEQLCDRIGVIREGRLLAVGTPEDIRRTLSGSTISIRARGLTDAIVSSLSVVKGVASLRLAADTLQVKLDGSGDVADMLQALMSSGVRIDEVRHDDDLERAVLSMLESAP